jgi:parallel beta-helix repeat protein
MIYILGVCLILKIILSSSAFSENFCFNAGDTWNSASCVSDCTAELSTNECMDIGDNVSGNWASSDTDNKIDSGDIIYFYGTFTGTTGTNLFTIYQDGVTLTSYPDTRAVLDGAANYTNTLLNQRSNVEIKNLKLLGGTASTLKNLSNVANQSYVNIHDNVFGEPGQFSVYNLGHADYTQSYITIKNNKAEGIGYTTDEEFVRTAPLNQISNFDISYNIIDGYHIAIRFFHASAEVNITQAGKRPDAIDVNSNTIRDPANTAISTQVGFKGASYVRNNNIIDCGDAGEAAVNCLQLNHLNGTIVEDNTIDGMDSSSCDCAGIILDWAWINDLYYSEDVILRNNKIINSVSDAGDGKGITVYRCKNCKIYGNVVYANEIGIVFADHAQNTGTIFYNNTSVYNTIDGIDVRANAPAATFVNNIFFGNTTLDVDYNSSNDPTSFINNILVDYDAGITPDSTNKIEDPKLESDYKLKKDSPAINAGDNSILDVGISDITGTQLTNSAGTVVALWGTVDIGAYQFDSIFIPGKISNKTDYGWLLGSYEIRRKPNSEDYQVNTNGCIESFTRQPWNENYKHYKCNGDIDDIIKQPNSEDYKNIDLNLYFRRQPWSEDYKVE